jgi:hypothetical protein
MTPKTIKVIECCGEDLHCYGFTTTCPICGADYNWAGNRLAPRECWGEETGEHWTDLMDIDTASIDSLLEGD